MTSQPRVRCYRFSYPVDTLVLQLLTKLAQERSEMMVYDVRSKKNFTSLLYLQ